MTGLSYFNQVSRLGRILGTDIIGRATEELKSGLRGRFQCTNQGFVDSLKMVFSGWWFDPYSKDLMARLLRVEFGAANQSTELSGPDGCDLGAVGDFWSGLDGTLT